MKTLTTFTVVVALASGLSIAAAQNAPTTKAPVSPNSINKGTEPCVIAFTLVSAKSVTAGGKTLPAQG